MLPRPTPEDVASEKPTLKEPALFRAASDACGARAEDHRFATPLTRNSTPLTLADKLQRWTVHAPLGPREAAASSVGLGVAHGGVAVSSHLGTSHNESLRRRKDRPSGSLETTDGRETSERRDDLKGPRLSKR